MLIALSFAISITGANAQSGFYLPTPTPSPGQDEFRASDGTSCRTTMDGSKRVEVGTFATGGQRQDNSYNLPGYLASPTQGNVGIYGRYTWSLDARPMRMDCNRLYQLEIEKREIEIQIMRRSLSVTDKKLDDVKKYPAKRGKQPGSMPPL